MPRPTTALTREDQTVYAAALRAIAPLDDAEMALGLAIVAPRDLSRGEHLLRAGQRAGRARAR